MHIQGTSQFRGFKYGQLSPLDFQGLNFWYRATDAVDFFRGNAISRWHDLSGKGNHLIPVNGASSAGFLSNTAVGPAWHGISAQVTLTTANPGCEAFLHDGSPYTIFEIILFNGAGSITTNAGQGNPRMSYGVNYNTATLRYYNASGSQLNSNGNMSYSTKTKSLFQAYNYGYNNSVTTPMYTLINGSQIASHLFNQAPAAISGSGQLQLVATTNRTAYLAEVIIYNQTGKTKTIIDTEMG